MHQVGEEKDETREICEDLLHTQRQVRALALSDLTNLLDQRVPVLCQLLLCL